MSTSPYHLRGALKLLITIFAFAFVMQISMSEQCSGRRYIRSSDYVESRLKGFIDFAKDFVIQSAAIISTVVDSIPNSVDYNDYRAQLEGYLIKLNQYRGHTGICAIKSLDVMTTFLTLTESFQQENITTEAEEIYLIMSRNGLLELESKAETWIAAFDEERFQKEYQEIVSADQNNNISFMFKEIC